MNSIIISIADIAIKVNYIYEQNFNFFKDYASETEPEIEITITTDDIERERELSAEEDKREGIPTRIFSAVYLETLAVLRKLASQLVQFNVILLHGSAISFNGYGVIFSADSGTGKSTHSRLWQEAYGDRVSVVNDDKPFVKVHEGYATVYGSPWDGKHHLSNNISVPLKALCALHRGNRDEVTRGTYPNFFYEFLKNVYIPDDLTAAQRVLALADKMIKDVDTYHLFCTMNQNAAKTACECIFGGVTNEN